MTETPKVVELPEPEDPNLTDEEREITIPPEGDVPEIDSSPEIELPA